MWSQTLLSGTEQEAMGAKQNTGGSTEHNETLLHYEADQSLAQVAQRGCGASVHGDIKTPAGHSLEQPVLTAPPPRAEGQNR